jgi:putative endonuclease
LEELGAHVYMLRCSDGSYYVGSARLGLERRLSEHNSGAYGGYTSKRLPVELVCPSIFQMLLTPLPWSGKSKAGLVQRKKH